MQIANPWLTGFFCLEKGLFCKIENDDLQNKRFFEGEVSKFRGKTLFTVTERKANYAKLLFCIIGRVADASEHPGTGI